ncbi:hypothetical protein D9M69_648310 [compost metagenome]
MLGHDGGKARFEHQHEGGEGRLQLDDDGLRVRRLHRIHELVQDHAGAGMGLGQHVRQRKHDVFGGERLAVVPLDVFLQVEGVGQAVRRGLPGFGEAGLRLQLG